MSQVTDALSSTTKLPGASGSLLRGVCAVGCTFLEAGQSQGWVTAGPERVGTAMGGKGGCHRWVGRLWAEGQAYAKDFSHLLSFRLPAALGSRHIIIPFYK